MNIIITLFLCCLLFSLTYWLVVQPVLAQKLRFNLFQIRDRVRKLVIDEAVEIDNPAYKYAETYICSLIALAPVTSLMAFLKFAFSSRHLEKRDGEFSFSENDPKRIVDACNEATAQFTGMMILNSPLLTLVLLLIALALWIRGGINRDAIFKKCEWYARSLRQPIDQHDLLSNLGCT